MDKSDAAPRSTLRRRSLIVGGFTTAGAIAGVTGSRTIDHLVADTAPAGRLPVPATEELMTDHGLLKRILLIYRECSRRLVAGDVLDPDDLFAAAQMVHDYIEGFHEGIEEGFVFPVLHQAGKLVDTVETLLVQHDRGRKITVSIIENSSPMAMAGAQPAPGFATLQSRRALATSLDRFVNMYEPHEAREDTEIFPTFREICPDQDFRRISEKISQAQEQTYGPNGAGAFIPVIADIEKNLGIHDLAKFTPPLTED